MTRWDLTLEYKEVSAYENQSMKYTLTEWRKTTTWSSQFMKKKYLTKFNTLPWQETLNKLGIEGTILNMIKAYIRNPQLTLYAIVKDWTLVPFPRHFTVWGVLQWLSVITARFSQAQRPLRGAREARWSGELTHACALSVPQYPFHTTSNKSLAELSSTASHHLHPCMSGQPHSCPGVQAVSLAHFLLCVVWVPSVQPDFLPPLPVSRPKALSLQALVILTICLFFMEIFTLDLQLLRLPCFPFSILIYCDWGRF